MRCSLTFFHGAWGCGKAAGREALLFSVFALMLYDAARLYDTYGTATSYCTIQWGRLDTDFLQNDIRCFAPRRTDKQRRGAPALYIRSVPASRRCPEPAVPPPRRGRDIRKRSGSACQTEGVFSAGGGFGFPRPCGRGKPYIPKNPGKRVSGITWCRRSR